MSNVIKLPEKTEPYFVIHGEMFIHVVPCALIKSRIDGNIPLIRLNDSVDDTDMLVGILREWYEDKLG